MTSSFNRPKKLTDFETEVLERLDCLQLEQARGKQDIREIIRQEIVSTLKEHSRKGWRYRA